MSSLSQFFGGYAGSALPGLQLKAWALVDCSATPPTVLAGDGVSGVSVSGYAYTIALSPAMATAKYIVREEYTYTKATNAVRAKARNLTTSNFILEFFNANNSALPGGLAHVSVYAA